MNEPSAFRLKLPFEGPETSTAEMDVLEPGTVVGEHAGSCDRQRHAIGRAIPIVLRSRTQHIPDSARS